jgi:hypothetical protein
MTSPRNRPVPGASNPKGLPEAARLGHDTPLPDAARSA